VALLEMRLAQNARMKAHMGPWALFSALQPAFRESLFEGRGFSALETAFSETRFEEQGIPLSSASLFRNRIEERKKPKSAFPRS
jgi:hypothetical protein